MTAACVVDVSWTSDDGRLEKLWLEGGAALSCVDITPALLLIRQAFFSSSKILMFNCNGKEVEEEEEVEGGCREGGG